MKKIIKLFFCVVLFAAIIIGLSPRSNNKEHKIIQTYAVETGMTYEEKVNELLSQFDDYQTNISGKELHFYGNIQTSYSESKIEYLADTNERLQKDYSASFDIETGIVTLLVTYSDEENIIKSTSYEAEPYYVEEDNDYYFDIDGEVYSISNMVMEGKINNCIAGVDDAAVVGGCVVLLAGAFLLTVITSDPTYQRSVTNVITQITEQITTVVKSILSWFKSIVQTIVRYVTKTIVTTIETVKTIYNITVASIAFTLEEATNAKYQDNGKYYLALADTVDGKVYMSGLEISKDFAIAVLSTGSLVSVATKSSVKVYLSTYTFREADARDIALRASSKLGMSSVVMHPAHISSGRSGMYFKHFHPCYPYQHSAHSFYDVPVIIV